MDRNESLLRWDDCGRHYVSVSGYKAQLSGPGPGLKKIMHAKCSSPCGAHENQGQEDVNKKSPGQRSRGGSTCSSTGSLWKVPFTVTMVRGQDCRLERVRTSTNLRSLNISYRKEGAIGTFWRGRYNRVSVKETCVVGLWWHISCVVWSREPCQRSLLWPQWVGWGRECELGMGITPLPVLVHCAPCCTYDSKVLGTLAINIYLENQRRHK